ncbi:MAG: hypothetical protein WDO69_34195 [Pseudomonadota bacterium]
MTSFLASTHSCPRGPQRGIALFLAALSAVACNINTKSAESSGTAGGSSGGDGLSAGSGGEGEVENGGSPGGSQPDASGEAGEGGSEAGSAGEAGSGEAGVNETGGTTGAGGHGGHGGASGGSGGWPQSCGNASQQEPNDTLGQATTIDLQCLLVSTLAPPADADDYYSFQAESGVTYSVNFWNTTLVNGVYVSAQFVGPSNTTTILNATGIAPNSNYDTELPAQASAGTVVLHLQASGGAVNYELSVVPDVGAEHDPVTFEWNDTPSEAAPLSLGTMIETQLSPPKDIVDNFSLPAVKDRYYAYTLTPTGGGVYLGGTLIPTTGQRVSLFTATGYAAGTTAYGEVHPSANGTSIFQFSQAGSSLYDFVVYPSTADGLVHDPVTYEPNNTLHTAAPIALGADVSATVNTTDDSVDFFQVPVEANVPYVLTFSNKCVTGGIYLSASAGDIAIIANTGIAPNTLNKTFVVTPSVAGLFVVALVGSGSMCPYSLSVVKQ